jgi:hypothetical protein
MREAAGFSEVLVTTHQTKWCHNPENDSLNFCPENFNSRLTIFFVSSPELCFEQDSILVCLGTVLDEIVVIHCRRHIQSYIVVICCII